MTNRDKNIVGQILAKTYRIERFLGVGTVGTVYVARHVRSGGLYAVKVLHRKLAASPDLYQRFQDEARLIATLRHPHILPITDFDRDENGIPFFVMDLLEGENLQQRLKHKEVLPVAQVMEIVQQVGSALHTAHRSGIVHRNIKPENVFLVRHDLGDRVTETAKIMDFGLARFRRMAPAGTRDASLGVSAYMAPEMLQETNAPIDGRADQWALAVIAYRMLAGKSPFEDENPEEMLRQILNEQPRPFPRMTPEMPAHMVAAIHRGMSKRREDRYETMMDFVRALSSRSSTTPEVSTNAAAPQARAVPGSGRVAAPMPPIPSGGAVPPPMPHTVSGAVPPSPAATPPGPAPANLPRSVPIVAAASPPTAGAPSRNTPATAAPAATAPSAASPPRPLLAAPPLLIPEDANPAPPPPPRGPSWGLLVSCGVVAVLAGVGLTLLWEQHQHPRSQQPPTVEPAKPEVAPEKVVVEPLQGGQQQPPEVPEVVDSGVARGPAAPQVPVPPLRSAGDETAQSSPPGTPAQGAVGGGSGGTPQAAPPTPGPTVPTSPSATPAQNPGTAVGTTSPAISNKGPAGSPGTGVPAPNPQTSQSAQSVNGAMRPTAETPTEKPLPPSVAPVTSHRDEVDELLGTTTAKPTVPPTTAAAPTTSATTAAAPTIPPPRLPPAQRPATYRPTTEATDSNAGAGGEPAEKSADKILEEAQASYVRGERQHAIDLAMQVTSRGNPADAIKAWRFIGSAACSVRSAPLATRAYSNLTSPEHRQLLTELCKRNGLNFINSQFVAE